MIGSAGHGKVLFEKYCSPCHGADAAGGMPNPGSALGKVPALHPISAQLRSAEPLRFATNLDRVLQNGIVSGGAINMPAFGDTSTLAQAEIADIIAYIMQLNGVDRAQLERPGIAPKTYFWLATGVSVAAGLLLAVAWAGMRPKT